MNNTHCWYSFEYTPEYNTVNEDVFLGVNLLLSRMVGKAWTRVDRPRTLISPRVLAGDPELPKCALFATLCLVKHTPYIDWFIVLDEPQKFTENLKADILTLKKHRDETGDTDFDEAIEMIEKIVSGELVLPNLWLGVQLGEGPKADRVKAFTDIPAAHRFLIINPDDVAVQYLRMPSDPKWGELPEGVEWVISSGGRIKNARLAATFCADHGVQFWCAGVDYVDVPGEAVEFMEQNGFISK